MENPRRSGSINEVLQAFEDTRARLKAFATLLDKAIFEGGGDLKRDSYGITMLFERELEDLEDELRGWNKHVEPTLAEAATVHDS